MKAINDANSFHALAYGDDPYTYKSLQKIKETFRHDADIYFVFNGTGANVLGLTSSTHSFNSIICAETAHIQVDECGAPEKFSGCKLLSVETKDGKLRVEDIKKHVHGFDFEHHSQPGVISITQSTELGTVYKKEEIKKICDYAHKNRMVVHVDGARIANAAVSLGLNFREFINEVGVDVLSFGGTKNGMMYGEAVIFFNKKISQNFRYIRKQGMQLASKMRFISAQFDAYLEDDLWLNNASHSNKMAQILYDNVKDIDRVVVTQKVEANSVFAIIPGEIIPSLQKEYFFYMWDENRSEVRWMCSFDTQEKDIEGFVRVLKKLLSKSSK